MYQLLSHGEHPLYSSSTDTYLDYLMKLRTIHTTHILPFPHPFPPHLSPLALDFFTRLCSYPPTLRYDAKSALKHPWITGQVDAQIPLT